MNHGRILINALRVPIIGFFYLLTYNAKLGSFMTLWIWFLVAVITFPTQIGPYHQRFVVYAFFLVWVAWLGITDIILCLLLLVSPVFPDFVQNTSSLLAYSVWRFIQYFFEGPNGARIEVSGDKLWEGESAVVIANHVSWTDFYLIHHLAIEAGMLGRCRWFAKKELKYVPFLGAACWAMGFPMLSRKWMRDQAEIDRAFHDIVERGWPTWLISFSEGTRFTPQKYAESHTYCTTHNPPLPVPQHLLYPRTKGFVSTIQQLRQAQHITAVYDFTLAYERNGRWLLAPSFADSIAFGDLSTKRGYRFHIHVRRCDMEEMPRDDGELRDWLERVWIEKGEWLEAKRMEWARKRIGG